uniref:NADH-ubiquinone oxidoreductase chain 2 n=1 Tax=Ceratophora ukuwelai TaxID=2778523 RepID=A0A7L8YQ17_9SAUR|nr:NADH dehydrogenase subunit 2 [Ceratophora ukuwelai]QOI31947.1 NADH dehydrogenase subunit 2 [Ceratophora ukuwelai]
MLVLIKILILSSLIVGTTLVVSSNNWLLAWLGLELNTLAILPTISKMKHPRATEATTKYFLTQAIASSLLLLASTTNAWQTGMWNITQMSNQFPSTIMLIALTMKMGAVPTHFWLPEVMQGTTLKAALLISTWQKIAPMCLMFTMSNHLPTNMTLIMGLLSTSFGGWAGMNQTQLRKIMAYSSIANMGWTLLTVTSEPKVSLINIFTYMMIATPTFFLMMMTSTKTLQDMATTWTSSPTMSTTLASLLLSMAGLPPLTGFLPKLLILEELVTQSLTPMAMMAATSSLLSLVFYLRIMYLTTVLNPPCSSTSPTKWRQHTSGTKQFSLMPPFNMLLTVHRALLL